MGGTDPAALVTFAYVPNRALAGLHAPRDLLLPHHPLRRCRDRRPKRRMTSVPTGERPVLRIQAISYGIIDAAVAIVAVATGILPMPVADDFIGTARVVAGRVERCVPAVPARCRWLWRTERSTPCSDGSVFVNLALRAAADRTIRIVWHWRPLPRALNPAQRAVVAARRTRAGPSRRRRIG